jgi:hypothetical protein
MQMLGIDAQLYEKILSIHDAAAHDSQLWQHFPINLIEFNNEQQRELARLEEQEIREL